MLTKKDKPYTSPLDAVAMSHHLLEAILEEGDIAVDATAGNGLDTIFLAKLVGEAGQVWAFDRQEEALHKAEANLVIEAMRSRTTLVCKDHSRFAEEVPEDKKGRVGAFLFNLGYLPGGNKEVTTTEATTLAAFRQALEWIRLGGVVVVVLYPGHPEGAREKEVLLKEVSALPVKSWQCLHACSTLSHRKNPPEVLALRRRK
ncbi:MAG: hypothetical protein JJT75_14530 [Opitutales bacterium]|nr:hypothetical protein [Opitutales bacterium]MCH8540089.1 hypothetical protein [Opitutales bacterium]